MSEVHDTVFRGLHVREASLKVPALVISLISVTGAGRVPVESYASIGCSATSGRLDETIWLDFIIGMRRAKKVHGARRINRGGHRDITDMQMHRAVSRSVNRWGECGNRCSDWGGVGWSVCSAASPLTILAPERMDNVRNHRCGLKTAPTVCLYEHTNPGPWPFGNDLLSRPLVL